MACFRSPNEDSNSILESRVFRISVHLSFNFIHVVSGDSQVVPVVKTQPANAEDTRDAGLLLGLGRLPGTGNNNLL